jgi:hypothetical protein
MGATLPQELDDPDAKLTPQLIIEVLRDVAWHFFPQLAPRRSSLSLGVPVGRRT